MKYNQYHRSSLQYICSAHPILRCLCGAALISVVTITPLDAVTVNVTSAADAGAGTLRQVIGDSAAGVATTVQIDNSVDPALTSGAITITGKQITITVETSEVSSISSVDDLFTMTATVPPTAATTSLTMVDLTGVTGAIAIGPSTTVTFTTNAVDTAYTSTAAGAISGGGSLVKTGTGTLAATGDFSQFQGAISVSTGTLSMTGEDNPLGASAVILGASTSFNYTIPTSTQETTNITSTGSGSSFLLEIVPTTALFSGAITQTATANTINVTFAPAVGKTLTIGSSANTYTGTTTINNGTVISSTSGALSSSSAYTIASGTLEVAAGGSMLSVAANGTSTLKVDAGGTLTIATTGASGLTSAAGATITLDGGIILAGTTSTLNGSLTGATTGVFTYNGSGALALNGSISAYLGKFVQTSGEITISGAVNGLITQISGGEMNVASNAATVNATISGGTENHTAGVGTLTLTQSGGEYTTTQTTGTLTVAMTGGSALFQSNIAVFNGTQSSGTIDVTGNVNALSFTTSGGVTTIDGTVSGGSATISGGTLDLTDSLQHPIAFTLTAPGVLEVTETSDVTVVATFAGTGGSIIKDGAGVLTINTNTTYAGDLTIAAGGLILNANYGDCSITTGAETTISRVFTVNDLTVGGTISPGNSIGQITVLGDYTQLQNSVFEVEINAAGAADLIAVSGAATIATDTLIRVTPAVGAYSEGSSYTVITANNGITGRFSGIRINNKSNIAPYSIATRYFPTEVQLFIFSPTDSILSQNIANDVLLPLQNNMSRMIVDGLFEQLDLENRLDRIATGCECLQTSGMHIYGSEFIQRGKNKPYTGTNSSFYQTYGTLIGADYIAPAGSVGVFTLITAGSNGSGSSQGSLKEMNYNVGGKIALCMPYGFSLRGVGGYGWNDTTLSYKEIISSQDGGQMFVQGAIENTLCLGAIRSVIDLSTRYSTVWLDGYTQKVGLLESITQSDTIHFFDLQAAISLGYQFDIGALSIIPIIGASALYGLHDNDRYVKTEYLDEDTDFYTYLPDFEKAVERVFIGIQIDKNTFRFSLTGERLFYNQQRDAWAICMGLEGVW